MNSVKIIPYSIATLVIFFTLVCISCNKDNKSTSTTKIKCVTCANGGLCINDTCRCPAGYEGVTCQTLSVEKFIGSWAVFEKGAEYSVQIQNNYALSANMVQISNFYNFYYYYSQVTGYISTDTLYIPLQHIQGKIVQGVGYIHSNPSYGQYGAITIRYVVKDSITGQVNDDFGYISSANSPSQWSK